MLEKKRFRHSQLLITSILVAVSLSAGILLVTTYMGAVNSFVAKIAEVSLGKTVSEITTWAALKSDSVGNLEKAVVVFSAYPEKLQEYASRVLDADKDFSDIYFVSAEPPQKKGFAIFGSAWIPPASFDWTARPWFIAALKSDGFVFSPPYQDANTGKMIFSISKRVFQNGRMIGVISSDIFATTVSELAVKAYLSANSAVNLVDAEGTYITSNKVKQGSSVNALSDYPELLKNRSGVSTGQFLIQTDNLRGSYYSSMGLGRFGWQLVAQGALSDFHDTSRIILSLVGVLFLLAGLFVVLLVRSWRSYAKLQVASGTLEKVNADLENTVAERTASLRNILDNAGEGFFTFGASLTVDPGYSRGCSDIFKKEIVGLSVPDVLFPGMSEAIGDFRQGFALYFEGLSQAEVIFDLTEKRAKAHDRVISVVYKETAGQKILCIMTDITLETEVVEKNRTEAERQQRILRALHHKHFFAQFIAEADDIFARLEVYASHEPGEAEAIDLMRSIHTLKGDCGFFCFHETHALAHESETTVSDAQVLGATFSYQEIAIQLKRAYYKELRAITDTMGEGWIAEASGITLPREAFAKIVAYIRKKIPGEGQLLQYLERYRKVTLSEIFSRLPFVAAATAEKLGKRVAPMTVSGGTHRVVPDPYQGLAEVCLHIVNNMVDHGIEYSYEREAIHKNDTGKLELTIGAGKSEFILEFRDDGRGINPRELERAGREKGFIKEGTVLSPTQLLGLLFEDGFSTKQNATAVSGRGVGMAAVKAEVDKLGGRIDVHSKMGKGTTITITIPFASHH